MSQPARRVRWAAAWLIAAALLLIAPVQAQVSAPETVVTPIALSGPASEAAAELSGLAWHGDTLVLLPENMNLYANAEQAGALFVLDETELLDYLDAAETAPLEPHVVPVRSAEPVDAVPGFDGYEAIAFGPDDQVYLVIEAASPRAGMRGFLVPGTIVGDLDAIDLDLGRRVELPGQTDFTNMSYESVVVSGDSVIALYEINGAEVNPDAYALAFSLDLEPRGALPVDALEYRLTDVTAPDTAGRVWGINYFFPGEIFLRPEVDPLAERYGTGPTHREFVHVERLVALDITPDAFRLADVPPLLLSLEEAPRNWEGIARLADRGFLLVTDRYPTTRLGFVPWAGE